MLFKVSIPIAMHIESLNVERYKLNYYILYILYIYYYIQYQNDIQN